MAVDPRTPVLVGVGQFTERIEDPGYRGMSSVELATAAAQAALRDTGADVTAVAAAIETVAAIRQFELSGRTDAPMGKSNNYPRSVANRIGAAPARAILEPIGGQGPQHLVTEFATHYNAERYHQGLDGQLIWPKPATSKRNFTSSRVSVSGLSPSSTRSRCAMAVRRAAAPLLM